MTNTLTQGIDGKTYKVNQETWFHPETPDRVIMLLVNAMQNNPRTRLKLTYGDLATGKAWGDVESGTVGRSTGQIKIPLMVKTSRSFGGGGILTHCIVKIEHANKKDGRAPLWDVTGRGYQADAFTFEHLTESAQENAVNLYYADGEYQNFLEKKSKELPEEVLTVEDWANECRILFNKDGERITN